MSLGRTKSHWSIPPTHPLIHSTLYDPPIDARQSWWQRFKAELPTKVERKKILPLTLMFFCMLFNYTILRDTKDVLVVTAPQSGACETLARASPPSTRHPPAHATHPATRTVQARR